MRQVDVFDPRPALTATRPRRRIDERFRPQLMRRRERPWWLAFQCVMTLA